MVGDCTGEREVRGLCLRCVPITAVADLQIRKSKSILLSEVVERKKKDVEVVGPTGEYTLLAVKTGKKHLWKEWLTT